MTPRKNVGTEGRRGRSLAIYPPPQFLPRFANVLRTPPQNRQPPPPKREELLVFEVELCSAARLSFGTRSRSGGVGGRGWQNASAVAFLGSQAKPCRSLSHSPAEPFAARLPDSLQAHPCMSGTQGATAAASSSRQGGFTRKPRSAARAGAAPPKTLPPSPLPTIHSRVRSALPGGAARAYPLRAQPARSPRSNCALGPEGVAREVPPSPQWLRIRPLPSPLEAPFGGGEGEVRGRPLWGAVRASLQSSSRGSPAGPFSCR